MANNIAFQPMGKTYALAANAVAQTVAVNADSPCNQLLVFNDSIAAVAGYVRFSSASGSNAAIAVAGTPAYGMPLHGQSRDIFTIPQSYSAGNNTVYVSIIMTGGTSNVYFTPGEGI
jgi:hypothetical protein